MMRYSTGLQRLDELLGGGLLPGTLTVVMGATGIGKTQLGLQFAAAGEAQESERGVLFDMTTRGDSQSHREYASRMLGWSLRERHAESVTPFDDLWSAEKARADYLHLFDRSGRRVTIEDIGREAWMDWKAEFNRKLPVALSFFFGNFCHGVRRCVIDGIEPTDTPSHSFQFHVFDYLYHQVVRKEAEWLARDLFRAGYREREAEVKAHSYAADETCCLLLLTAHDVMLESLIARPIQTGDLLSNANTVIQMGKIREGDKLGRALCVTKHRGSFCDESLVRFEINESGLSF